MAINETLKFSWGHIIAVVALIFIRHLFIMQIHPMENRSQ